MRILHLTPTDGHADLVRSALGHAGTKDEWTVVESPFDGLVAADAGRFDLVLSTIPAWDVDALMALGSLRRRHPELPFLIVSEQASDAARTELFKAAGATECVPPSDPARVLEAMRRALDSRPDGRRQTHFENAAERLVMAVQEMSLARDLDRVMTVVRQAARRLTGADGATFILRAEDQCFYADEDAIAPLWKGRRFPMRECVSGWAMLNRQPAVMADIYADARVPHDAYRQTFVKSLVMVPIRALDPIGAIGIYWAETHEATTQEVKLLQALADTAAVALENVQVYAALEQRVRDRTAELEATNQELEAFSYAVSHDLRAPLRHITGFCDLLVKDCGDRLSEQGQHYLSRVQRATQRLGQLTEDLLALSRTTQAQVVKREVDLSRMAHEVIAQLQSATDMRALEARIAGGLLVRADPRLLKVVMENLLANAWKFTAHETLARIEVGSMEDDDGAPVYYVRDNGVGFDMAYASRLFGVFQRLHADGEFPGTGIGLATVQRVIHKHGGRIWAQAAPGEGATFCFTLP